MSVPSTNSQPPYRIIPGGHISVDLSDFADSVDLDLYESSSSKRNTRIVSKTHDLAEFCRSFGPEDFNRHSKSITVDDLALPSRTQKKGPFKFLKLSSKEVGDEPRDISTFAVPAKIARPQKTAKGRPYLAIQVEYDPMCQINKGPLDSYINLPTPVSDEFDKRDSFFACGGFSSDLSHYRSSETSNHNSSTSQSNIDIDSKTSPPPWSSSLRSQNNTQYCSVCQSHHGSSFDNCSITPSQASPPARGNSTTTSLRTDVDILRGEYIIRPFKRSSTASSAEHTIASTNMPAYYSTMPRIPRSDSFGKGMSKSPSASQRSSLRSFTDENKNTGLDQLIREVESPKRSVSNPVRKLPRPGPPPNRGLPSLPEGYDDVMGSPIKVYSLPVAIIQNVESCTSIDNLPSMTVTTKPLPFSFTGDEGTNEVFQAQPNFRKQREASVKAKRLRDLQDLKQRREKRYSDSSTDIRPLETNKILPLQGTSSKSSSNATSKIRGTRNGARTAKALAKITTLNFSSIMVVCDQPPTETAIKVNAEELFDAKINQPAVVLQNNILAIKTSSESFVAITKANELESRIINMERRNLLLEQALLVVLQGASHHGAQSRTGLIGSSPLEDVVKKLSKQHNSHGSQASDSSEARSFVSYPSSMSRTEA